MIPEGNTTGDWLIMIMDKVADHIVALAIIAILLGMFQLLVIALESNNGPLIAVASIYITGITFGLIKFIKRKF